MDISKSALLGTSLDYIAVLSRMNEARTQKESVVGLGVIMLESVG